MESYNGARFLSTANFRTLLNLRGDIVSFDTDSLHPGKHMNSEGSVAARSSCGVACATKNLRGTAIEGRN